MTEIPEGFVLASFVRPVPFVDLIGPIYLRHGAAGVDAGAWVTESKCNGGRMAYGAFLLALADIATGRVSTEAASPGFSAVHISLGMEYFAPVPFGSWVEAHARLDRKGRSVIFSTCNFYLDGEKIGRATAVMKTVRLAEPPSAE